jgi:hypothetical protein
MKRPSSDLTEVLDGFLKNAKRFTRLILINNNLETSDKRDEASALGPPKKAAQNRITPAH